MSGSRSIKKYNCKFCLGGISGINRTVVSMQGGLMLKKMKTSLRDSV